MMCDDVVGMGGVSWVGELFRGGRGGGADVGTTTLPRGLRRMNRGLLPGDIMGLADCLKNIEISVFLECC